MLIRTLRQAYKLLYELRDNAAICCAHSLFMKSCQYSDLCYIPAGKTRTETWKTVIVAGAYKIECCPFPDVDRDLEHICKMARVSVFVAPGLLFTRIPSGFYFPL